MKEHLCPDEEQLIKTLEIRNNPLKYREQEECKAWLASLGPAIQQFADVLERELA